MDQIFDVLIVLILTTTKKKAEYGKMPVLRSCRDSLLPPWMPISRDSPPLCPKTLPAPLDMESHVISLAYDRVFQNAANLLSQQSPFSRPDDIALWDSDILHFR